MPVDLLAALLGGTVEALVGKAVELGLAKGRKLVDNASSAAWSAATESALTRAREALVSIDLGTEAARRRVVGLLDSRVFALEVGRTTLFGEGEELDGVFAAYRKMAEADGASPTGDEVTLVQQALGTALSIVQTELSFDPNVSQQIQQGLLLAKVGKFSSSMIRLAESGEKIEANTSRIAKAAERNTELLTDIRDRLPAPPAKRDLTPEEEEYLNRLIEDCEALPLAEDRRARSETKKGNLFASSARLSRVYVDLATHSAADWALACLRLGLSSQEAKELRLKLSPEEPSKDTPRHLEAAGAELERQESGPVAALARQDDDFFEQLEGCPEPVRDSARRRAAVAPMTTLEAMERHQHWILLGSPGSGKSSFVQYAASKHAGRLLEAASPATSSAGTNSGSPLFPIRIVLRRWAAEVALKKKVPSNLMRLAVEKQAEEATWEAWKTRFHKGALVFFDGLDEVPNRELEQLPKTSTDRNLRTLLLRSITRFAAGFPRVKVVLTCRERPWRLGEYSISSWPELTLVPLDASRIEEFCAKWHEEMRATEVLTSDTAAEECQQRLLLALRDERRATLRQMAETPLLLTMLARVNLRERLPEGRLALYGQCVDQLLWEWERRKAEGTAVESLDRLLATLPSRPEPKKVEEVLWQLAYKFHPRVVEGVADIPEEELWKALKSVEDRLATSDELTAWAGSAVELLKRRDGLLVFRGDGVFSFPHRSFQEYLAARWLARTPDPTNLTSELAGNEVWDEVVSLAYAQLSRESRGRALRFLFKAIGKARKELQRRESWRRLVLLGRVAAELKVGQPGEPDRNDERVRTTIRKRLHEPLDQALHHQELPPAQRLEAGEILADLGIRPPDLGELVEVPDRGLGYSFEIGRYPVTNFEYRKFFEAGGYERDQPWWSEEAKKEIERWRKWPSAPVWWDDPKWNRDTFPVVGVSWYEALAYCAWLSEQHRQDGKLEAGRIITLPTAAEWQAAANGPGSGKYPWGDEPDSKRANTSENGLGRTSPVHMHLAQTSEPKLFDLVGNVWEWLSDRDKDGWPYLAGGAFWNDISKTTTAARGRFYPGYWYFIIGFRVVLVPSSRRSSGS